MKSFKVTLAALASLVLVSATAEAKGQSTLANVPTGVNVKGCTDYKLLPRNKVMQVCGKKAFIVNFKRRWKDSAHE